MTENERKKVKKGWLAVRVGLEDEGDGGFRKFTIPISHLHHPLFANLLNRAREVYGYQSTGPLRLPCSIDDFLHIRWLIERESLHFQHHSSPVFLSPCYLPSVSCSYSHLSLFH
ncbi:putative Auxin-induced protein 6B [Cocos nucifera]|uniref:Putative Auxin-induced protein 6B n=1 Tax=Cocos nucifera TaxID=13894 RepID=A0A8K0I399_COCNU|nr:putative Auxin-induced protein 6B [Cocos nucifera]